MNVLLAAVFPLLVLGFGWAVLTRFGRLDGPRRFAASFAVGLVPVALSAGVAFAAHLPPAWVNLATALGMVLAAAACLLLPGSRPATAGGIGWLLALWGLAYAQLVLTQALLP